MAEAERKVAVVTGTSRDVGEYIALGLGQAGYDILGIYRNPQHDQDQADIIKRVESNKVRMTVLRADLTESSTPGLLLAHGRGAFGERKYSALILSAATGFGRPIKEARVMNVDRQMQTVETFLPHLAEGAVIAYLTSNPAHRWHTLENPQKQLGPYNSVAQTKNETGQILRSRTAEFAKRGIRFAEVVGNVLEGTFISRVLKGRYKGLLSQMEVESEKGIFPTAMDMASAVVRVVRGNYPSGYTEYVGIKPEYQFYPPRPLGLSLVGAPQMREGSILSLDDIYNTIPHRWPYMFIGGVDELIPGERATGSLVNLNHPDINWTGGHFPDYPLIPGAITQEALEQLGALTVLSMPKYKGLTAVLTGIDEMLFSRQIVPGDDVRLEVKGMDIREIRRMITGKGHARALNASGKVAVEGNISFSLLDLS